jgi:hypothetical protein
MSADDPVLPLPPDRLYRAADIAALDFATTRELAPLHGFAEQPRAHEAIRFGTDMAVRGFNIFAIGANGAHIQDSVRSLLEDAASRREKPSDWVYVNNFAVPHRPVAIALPPGRAPALDKALDHLIDDLKVSLPAAFESEDYQKRRSGIEQEIRNRNERSFTAVRDKATSKGVAILRTPMGFAMAPMKDGQVVQPARRSGSTRCRLQLRRWRRTWKTRCAGCRGRSAHCATRCGRWIRRWLASPSRSRSRSARHSSPTCRK